MRSKTSFSRERTFSLVFCMVWKGIVPTSSLERWLQYIWLWIANWSTWTRQSISCQRWRFWDLWASTPSHWLSNSQRRMTSNSMHQQFMVNNKDQDAVVCAKFDLATCVRVYIIRPCIKLNHQFASFWFSNFSNWPWRLNGIIVGCWYVLSVGIAAAQWFSRALRMLDCQTQTWQKNVCPMNSGLLFNNVCPKWWFLIVWPLFCIYIIFFFVYYSSFSVGSKCWSYIVFLAGVHKTLQMIKCSQKHTNTL